MSQSRDCLHTYAQRNTTSYNIIIGTRQRAPLLSETTIFTDIHQSHSIIRSLALEEMADILDGDAAQTKENKQEEGQPARGSPKQKLGTEDRIAGCAGAASAAQKLHILLPALVKALATHLMLGWHAIWALHEWTRLPAVYLHAANRRLTSFKTFSRVPLSHLLRKDKERLATVQRGQRQSIDESLGKLHLQHVVVVRCTVC